MNTKQFGQFTSINFMKGRNVSFTKQTTPPDRLPCFDNLKAGLQKILYPANKLESKLSTKVSTKHIKSNSQTKETKLLSLILDNKPLIFHTKKEKGRLFKDAGISSLHKTDDTLTLD
jgi:hypothetical protein|eukprot:TRINITY_DN699_c0_g1_i5.p4 TRINITY_DN699_c0_g1~~TRINITY_DN699_c0_g1_i5.p4  ORF type:complete len:117 (+),score=9.59 TRINITY_DN699_c0_g1_i5:1014-1364(+)